MLPDVTALGPYTYLATLVFWGSLAAALVYRAGAARRAAKTVAVLYPIGYLWDWYSLEVGVFSIPMRTGVELLGIPIEEHLFILVIPTMVIGVHETLHAGARPERSGHPERSDRSEPAHPERGGRSGRSDRRE